MKKRKKVTKKSKKPANPYALLKDTNPRDVARWLAEGHITQGQVNAWVKKKTVWSEQKLAELDRKLDIRVEQVQQSDPFYYFEPNTGILSDEQKAFLGEFLKPEDIPERVDGQDDAILCESPILGVSGGNQSSKTTTCCIRTYIQATGEVPFPLKEKFPKSLLPKSFPQRWRVSGVSDSTLASTVFPTYQKWVPRRFLKNGSWSDSFSSKYNTLSLYDHNTAVATIEFKTDRQDTETRQGSLLDGTVYDEEPRYANYEEDLLRFVTADRMNILFGFTPTKGLSWTADYFLDPEEGVKLFKLCTATNRFANLDVVRRIINQIKQKYGESESYKILKMRLLGEFISLSGLVYGSVFNRNYHVIEPFYEDLERWDQRDYMTISGWDPHYVTATAGVFLLVDREGVGYVDYCYDRQAETDDIKADFQEIVKSRNYRMGWSTADMSSDVDIVALGRRNIYKELSQGENRIPALKKSKKFRDSIHTGVDVIKKAIKNNMLFIIDRPENKNLIRSFMTLERDTFANEDIKGEKDSIREGKHHLHAALRYIYQYPVSWIPETIDVPEQEPVCEAVGW